MDPTQMNIKDLIIYSFICVSLIEESSKLFFLYKSSYNHKEFDYTFDMIVYSVFVSLGFAFFENILYISKGGLLTGISRAFTAIPAHASYGVFMGIFLSKAKCYEVKNPNKSKLYKLLALLVPILMHGLYDVFAFKNQKQNLFIFIIFLFATTETFLQMKKKDDMKISMYNIE
jgi:RsiW-degrading membrane proteinase PrsW (M82 family)